METVTTTEPLTANPPEIPCLFRGYGVIEIEWPWMSEALEKLVKIARDRTRNTITQGRLPLPFIEHVCHVSQKGARAIRDAHESTTRSR